MCWCIRIPNPTILIVPSPIEHASQSLPARRETPRGLCKRATPKSNIRSLKHCLAHPSILLHFQILILLSPISLCICISIFRFKFIFLGFLCCAHVLVLFLLLSIF